MDDAGLVSERWEALRGSYSPDGDRLAFLGTKSDPSAVDDHVVVVEGDSERDVTPDDWVAGYGWMPDSRSILVSLYDDEVESTTLAIVDLKGGKLRAVPTTEPMLAVGGLAPLPDGRRAILAAQAPGASEGYTDLFEVDLTTGELKRLTTTTDLVEVEPVLLDAENLAFGGGKLTGDFGGPNGWIGVLNITTGEVRRLTPESQTAGSPTVSPDGKAIVYDAFPGNDLQGRALWRVPIAGGEPELVVERDVQYPAFLRNGSVVGQVEGTGRLEIIRLPG